MYWNKQILKNHLAVYFCSVNDLYMHIVVFLKHNLCALFMFYSMRNDFLFYESSQNLTITVQQNVPKFVWTCFGRSILVSLVLKFVHANTDQWVLRNNQKPLSNFYNGCFPTEITNVAKTFTFQVIGRNRRRTIMRFITLLSVTHYC